MEFQCARVCVEQLFPKLYDQIKYLNVLATVWLQIETTVVFCIS